MKWTKIFLVNLCVFIFLMGLLLLTPPLTFYSRQFIVEAMNFAGMRQDIALRSSHALPNYADFSWAAQYDEELANLRQTYHDYIIWRRDDFAGETITVQDGLRFTVNPDAPQQGIETWFFGGSTMWGTGNDDTNTIPSVFSQMTSIPSINFGETSYTSRQSLAMLTNAYIERDLSNTERLIVFYDGVNDVGHWCRSEVGGLHTNRQDQIRDALRVAQQPKWSFRRTFEQVTQFVSRITGGKSNPSVDVVTKSRFDCASSQSKAERVARQTVNTWLAARALVEGKGDRFVAVLQPVASVGTPNLDHLVFTSATQDLLNQYPKAYPLIRKFAKESGVAFIDLSHGYDGDELAYIDFCHVSPQGHHKIVPMIIAALRDRGMLPAGESPRRFQ